MKNTELIPASAEVVEVIEHPAHPPAHAPANPLLVAHSLLRGRYVLAICLALVGAAVGAVVGYLLVPPEYRSTGMIHVKPTLPVILQENDINAPIPRFDGFVSSQVQLMQSRRVVSLAMQDANWRKFGRGISDREVAAFIEKLDVGSPRGSELIQVGFTDPDPSAAAAAVTAVINAYLKVRKDFDAESGVPRMQALENIRNGLEVQVVNANRAIRDLVNEFGNELSLQKMLEGTITEVEGLRTELERIQILSAQLAQRPHPAPEDAPLALPTQEELRMMLDPEMRGLRNRHKEVRRNIDLLAATYGPEHRIMQEARASLEAVEQDVRDHEAFLRSGVGANALPLAPEGQVNLDQLAATEQQLRTLHDRAVAKMLELGRKQGELDRMKEGLADLRSKLEETRARIYGLETEEKYVGGRISMISEGERPVSPYKDRRKALAAVGGLGMAGLGIGSVLLLGLADRRMHRIADASAHLRTGSKVLGIVPELEEQGLDLGSATLAAHCVHQIRAMLQMRRGQTRHQTFAVTSPSAGDGKTTLVMALGMSYAASGTRTLLIDLDLIGGGLTARIDRAAHRKLGRMFVRDGLITSRQLVEALDSAKRQGRRIGEVLVETGAITNEQLERTLLAQLQTSVGVGEVLDGDPLAESVAATGIPNLYVLRLGSAGREHVSQLSPELIDRIVAEAQKHFAAVLIDTGPILGSLEAAMICGGSAGVILTVSRGGNKSVARRATEELARAGATISGIVFNRAEAGDMENSGYSSYRSRASQAIQVHRTNRAQLTQPVAARVEAAVGWSEGGKHS